MRNIYIQKIKIILLMQLIKHHCLTIINCIYNEIKLKIYRKIIITMFYIFFKLMMKTLTNKKFKYIIVHIICYARDVL